MILEILWTLVAFSGMLRALYLLREYIIDRRSLASATNGRRILANWQVEHGAMGVLMYFFLFCPGALATAYKFGMASLESRLNLAALFLVAALFTLVIRQERDAHYRRRTLRGAPPQMLADVAQDTNQRVRRIERKMDKD